MYPLRVYSYSKIRQQQIIELITFKSVAIISTESFSLEQNMQLGYSNYILIELLKLYKLVIYFMKARSPSMHITLQSIDNISLACINPPVPRKYASTFKSKLARFVSSITEPTLMNIMEYLIKFKQWYLRVREGHTYPILLYEDLLIISLFKVNQNQLMHTEMSLILSKLQQLLGRTKRAIQVRCFSFLIHLTDQQINRAVITDTDFLIMKQRGKDNLNIKSYTSSRHQWALQLQKRHILDQFKQERPIQVIVGQRMAAIRMHYLNTLTYTEQISNSISQIIEEADTINSQNTIVEQQQNLTQNIINFKSLRTASSNEQETYKRTIKSAKNKAPISQFNDVDKLIHEFRSKHGRKHINNLSTHWQDISAVKVIQNILRHYLQQPENSTQSSQSNQNSHIQMSSTNNDQPQDSSFLTNHSFQQKSSSYNSQDYPIPLEAVHSKDQNYVE